MKLLPSSFLSGDGKSFSLQEQNSQQTSLLSCERISFYWHLWSDDSAEVNLNRSFNRILSWATSYSGQLFDSQKLEFNDQKIKISAWTDFSF